MLPSVLIPLTSGSPLSFLGALRLLSGRCVPEAESRLCLADCGEEPGLQVRRARVSRAEPSVRAGGVGDWDGGVWEISFSHSVSTSPPAGRRVPAALREHVGYLWLGSP